MIFKSTHEILNSPWTEKEDMHPTQVPPKWNDDKEITIDDVVIWEQIYHQPGNLGIYVAWSPFAEFYMISYDMFTGTSAGIKTFNGPHAMYDVVNQVSKLGIDLPINRIPA